MTICNTCANKQLCKQWSFSMAKCSDYDPIFDAIKTAVNTYGIEKQLTVLYGEIGEMMTAIADYRRGRDTTDHIAEEMADVLICCKQVMYALGVTRRDVLQWQDHKLRRLAMRLAEKGEQPEPDERSRRVLKSLEACTKLNKDNCKKCGYYGQLDCHIHLKHDAAYLIMTGGSSK